MIKVILFILLMFVSRAYAGDFAACERSVERAKAQGPVKWHQILYPNKLIACFSKNNKIVSFQVAIVPVKGIEKASASDKKQVFEHYRQQILKDLCPGMSWKVADEMAILMRGLDNKDVSSVDLNQQTCNYL